MVIVAQNSQCYCGAAQPFSNCCGLLINGQAVAQHPEQLMRSRYSAFCEGNIGYLVATLHPSKRQVDDRDVLLNTINNTLWQRLKVIAARQQNSRRGEVEFVAFFGTSAQDQMHELSQFVKEDGLWYYLDGQMLDHHSLGRNELCWCGKNKKLKHCHRES